MQYGARQIFPATVEYLKANPDIKVILSPSWANGTDVVARFMLSDPLPIELGSIDGYFNGSRDMQNTTFVMIPDEYERTKGSDKFANIHILQTLNLPDGTPGFYFVRLEYAPGIKERLEAEKEARRALVVGRLVINGNLTEVHYSMLDMGVIGSGFDGDNATVIRTLEANPFVIELYFQESMSISGITLRIGGTTTWTTLYLESDDGTHLSLNNHASVESHPRDVIINLDKPKPISFIRIEIESLYDPEPAHVHLWEVTFK